MRLVRLLAGVILIKVALAACQAPANQPSNDTAAVSSAPADCRVIAHEMGITEVCGQPQRIVVFGPNILEPLLALNIQPMGYADQATFHQGDYTNPSQQIPYLGKHITQPIANLGLFNTPSIEGIARVQPDLILGNDNNDYETLSKIAPTLLIDRYDAEISLRTIAQAVDRTEQAKQLLAQREQQIAAAQATFATLVATHPKVILPTSLNSQEVRLEGPAGPCSSLVKQLGFQLVLPPEINRESIYSVPISFETLPQLNDADLIILLGYNFSDFGQLHNMERFEEQQLLKLKEAWKKNAIAQSLDASKAGQVYSVPAYLCRGLPGPIGTDLYLKALEEQLLAPN
ncbi:MAG: ABC transporter substrate-binding protein [Leptolyngbyaceae cyanobacterium]